MPFGVFEIPVVPDEHLAIEIQALDIVPGPPGLALRLGFARQTERLAQELARLGCAILPAGVRRGMREEIALEALPAGQQRRSGLAVAILVGFACLGDSQLIPLNFDGALLFRQRIAGGQGAEHKQRRRVPVCLGPNFQLPPASLIPAFARAINEIHHGKRRWNRAVSTEYKITQPGSGRRLKPRLRHHRRGMEVLSENMCQGWLEGYLLSTS